MSEILGTEISNNQYAEMVNKGEVLADKVPGGGVGFIPATVPAALSIVFTAIIVVTDVAPIVINKFSGGTE